MLSIIRLTCISNQVYVNKNWENSGARSQRNGGWSNTAAREKKNTNTVSSIPGTLIRVFPWHRPELRRFRLETSSLLFLSSLTKEERTATSFWPMRTLTAHLWMQLLLHRDCNCLSLRLLLQLPSLHLRPTAGHHQTASFLLRSICDATSLSAASLTVHYSMQPDYDWNSLPSGWVALDPQNFIYLFPTCGSFEGLTFRLYCRVSWNISWFSPR